MLFDIFYLTPRTFVSLFSTGYRVAQVRAVFRIPDKASAMLFHGVKEPKHLAYVEWFTKFPQDPDRNYGMYELKRAMKDNKRVASVIPVSDISRTVHLYPKWGPAVPREWTTNNVLEECASFYVSSFLDRHTYITVY